MSTNGVSHVDLKYLDPEESGLSLEVKPDERKLEVNWEVTGPAQPIDLGGTGIVDMDMN